MTILLLNLRQVPEDEASEVRDLLAAHHVDFYETKPSFWGVSSGAIWLRDKSREDEVRELLDAYQHARAQRMRARYTAALEVGEADTLMRRLWRHPVRSVMAILAVFALCALSVLPFLSLLNT